MRTVATLRIIGDDLIPDEISKILGCEPSRATFKGQVIRGKTTGHERVARTGSWHIETDNRVPQDLNGQILEILGRLNPDMDVWAFLADRFRIDVFCGLFMASRSEGLTLSPQVLLALGARRIELDLCLYDPTDD